ncbi:glycosyltransferase family 2 protein [Mesobacillus sp. AQ2]|jgi:polyisoprenyl-phosphate glycosyltransferase|uniref:glycosyltransferase family 2 protein n=1 Tax=Bacillaceae TaxID=186817 RepID=UPI0011AA07EB|nr:MULTISPECIES: glycosyltransferase family 2 protein [Bacillaceae]MCM3121840.1 glycosyltransferase family 2 protein [Mesobacillus sp. MER 33]MCM3231804.1 glycosyltransferase family 2 protein [Mesobacillus sp. MER 48]WHX38771.1 glycosyltransferase family 2 protein [Mesobacillus sp. AQ2]
MNLPILSIIVPCYNEQEVLEETIEQLTIKLEQMINENLVSKKSKILFVDDGSKDNTWHLIYKASLKNELIKGLKLSKNAGHQNALLAGLFAARDSSDCLVSIDADLQDDIDAINKMVRKYIEGYEIVYGVRSSRESDTFFKRLTAEGFYKLMDKLGVKLIFNHADFRLMSRRAVDELERFAESNMFLRGIVPLIGFNSANVYYERKERFAGETKYPLKKMLAFAFDGITSFSVTPIRLVMLIGCLSFIVSLISGIYFLALKFFGNTELGWTSLITSIWLIGGLQLIALGLVGEYIGKIYKETKRRPKYIVDVDLFNLPLPRKLVNKEEDEYESIIETRKLSENN